MVGIFLHLRNKSKVKEDFQTLKNDLKDIEGEKITGAVYGIIVHSWGHPYRSKDNLLQRWPPNRTSDTEEASYAILFTNYRIFFMFVRTGSKPYVLGSRPHLNAIKQKCEEMISKMSVRDILSNDLYNYAIPYVIPYNEVESVTLKTKKDRVGALGYVFYIKTQDKRKFRCALFFHEEIDNLESLLKQFLSSKIVRKN
jgi:hypothetical protein